MAFGSRATWPAAGLFASVLAVAACGGDQEGPGAAGIGASSGQLNAAPSIDEITLEPPVPGAREPVRATVRASDEDGDSLVLDYRWTLAGREVYAGPRRSVELKDSKKGDRLVLVVTASDGREVSEKTVELHIGNRAPRIVGLRYSPPGAIQAGREIDVVVDAVDPDGDELEYEYRWIVNGREVDAETARLPGALVKRGDTVQVTVVASDGEDESDIARSPAFAVENSPPEARAVALGVGADGVVRYRIEATDPDGDSPLRVRLLSGPRGMTFDAVGAELRWAPERADAGRHTVVIEVDDGRGAPVTQRFPVELEFEETAPASPVR